MRISTNLLSNNILSYIQQDERNIFWNNQRISSTKKILQPSDNPLGTDEAIKIQNSISVNDQYETNCKDAISWLNSSENATNNLLESLTGAYTIATQGTSSISSAGDRQTMGNEVNQLLEDFFSNANSQDKGKYIFGGTQTLSSPYTAVRNANGQITAVNTNPNSIDGIIDRQISSNETIQINTSGDDIFQLTGGGSSFQVLINLRDALYSNDTAAVTTAMTQIEEAQKSLDNGLATIGARESTINSHISNIDQLQITRKASLSNIEDTDVTAEAADLQRNELALEAALQTGTKIMQLSIVNFI